MKRKRGKAKSKSKKASLAGTNEAISKGVGLNTDYTLEDLLCEHNATLETETPQDEPSMKDHHATSEQEVVASKRIKDTGNSVHNTNTAFLGNLSKFAANTPAKSSRGDDTYAKYDSRMESETLRGETSMSRRQTDSGNGGASVNGVMGSFPSALREIVISVFNELSKEAGDVTAKMSSGITSKPISNARAFLPQGERSPQEVSPNLNPQYKKQELNVSLSVIRKIMNMKAAEPFSVPIDPIELGIPDYLEVIDMPMDFGTICYNLENCYKYMNSEDVYKDVQLIWENCSKYNKAGDYILELMKKVKTNFMKYWMAAGLHMEHEQATNAMPTRGRGRINQPLRGETRGLSIDRAQHKQDLPYESTGDEFSEDELSEDGVDISLSPEHNQDMVDEDTPGDDAMPPKGRGRINQPSKVLSIIRGHHVQDLPCEPVGDDLPGDGMDMSRSHRHYQDNLDEDTSRDDDEESKGVGGAPRPPEDLEQRIPVIVYKGMLVVPPQEDGINFPSVGTGIVNAIQGKFVVGEDGPTWKKVSADMKEYYFKEWNRQYKCADDLPESEIKRIWNVMAGEQYKRMCFRARQQFRRSGHPSWCGEVEWKRHLLFYANEKMKKKCEQARKNRNSDRDGLGKSKHSGGSRSFVLHELVMKKQNPEKVITEDEVFLRTHRKKGTDEVIDAKAKKIFEDYTALKDGPGFDRNAWIEASGGVAKNRVYGFGSLATASSIMGKTPPSLSYGQCQNEDFTQSQQFNEKVCKKVDQMKAEIHNELKTQLQSELGQQMEKMKADFELRLQEAIKSLVTTSQHPLPRST